jgi:predicted dehydrogenase
VSAPLRFGLLGCGAVAYWAHLRTFRHLKGAVLVAAADPDATARTRAARLTRAALYERAEDLLARDDLDAVVISAPTPQHAQLAVATAAARRHFYLEKPLATTAAEGRRVLAAAGEAAVTTAIGFNFRFHPALARARTILARGRIGRVCAVQTTFCESLPADAMPSWKRRRDSGGGVLLDLASHHVDLVRWCLGDEVTMVEAEIRSLVTEEDVASVVLTMASGIAVQSYFSLHAGPVDRVEFIGEHGTLLVDRHRCALRLRVPRRLGYGLRTVWAEPAPGLAAVRIHRLVRPSYEPSFAHALAAFVERLRGRDAPIAALDEGARSLTVVLAAEEAARRRVPIVVGTL